LPTTLLNRRQFTAGAAAGLAAAALPSALLAQDKPPVSAWEEAVNKVLGGAKPVPGKMVIEMPEIAENGNTVPFSVTVESPMTDKDFVKAVHVIATANPQPGIATFRFTPLAGKASVSSRLRLARTQDIVAVAELSDGRFVMEKRNVKVTIGGCGG
jgi:sulfur-oxidizing protein SoxY